MERSHDGRTFEHIGTVAAQGSTSSPSNYRFLDSRYSDENNGLYYRLRQVDLDGSASYSPVRVVSFPAPPLHLTLFPNPAHAAVAVAVAGLSAGAPVEVFDALGRAVARATADAGGNARLALPAGLPTGIYLVRSGPQTRRLMVCQ